MAEVKGPDTQSNSQVVDTISIENLKTVAGASAFAMAQVFQAQSQALGMQFQNATSHQNRLNLLAEAYVGRALTEAASVDPAEAVATAKLFKGESDSSLLSLLTALSGGQIGAKIGQSTPGDVAGDIARLSATVAAQSAQLGSVIAALQQIMKGAGNTPPVTP